MPPASLLPDVHGRLPSLDAHGGNPLHACAREITPSICHWRARCFSGVVPMQKLVQGSLFQPHPRNVMGKHGTSWSRDQWRMLCVYQLPHSQAGFLRRAALRAQCVSSWQMDALHGMPRLANCSLGMCIYIWPAHCCTCSWRGAPRCPAHAYTPPICDYVGPPDPAPCPARTLTTALHPCGPTSMAAALQVSEGSGKLLVVAVGENSEWGKTMALVGEAGDDETPLQVRPSVQGGGAAPRGPTHRHWLGPGHSLARLGQHWAVLALASQVKSRHGLCVAASHPARPCCPRTVRCRSS